MRSIIQYTRSLSAGFNFLFFFFFFNQMHVLGTENLRKNNIKLKHVLTLSQVVDCLCKNKKIDEDLTVKVSFTHID